MFHQLVLYYICYNKSQAVLKNANCFARYPDYKTRVILTLSQGEEVKTMNSRLFIAGDWGTSNLRIFLCEYKEFEASIILETITGPGVSQVQADFENVFFTLIDAWLKKHGPLPVIISGMAGSTIGWQEAPYIQCPTDAKKISEGRITFEARGVEVSIISGLKAENPIGSPDVMRGEELQLMGWMQLNNMVEAESSTHQTRLVVLPGTHNKWVLLKEGRIETFVTALTGEMFALLKNHSVLIADKSTNEFDEPAFFKGVEAIERLGDAHLLHGLFSTRSEQILGDLVPEQALSYLSGLLITSDISGAISLFRKTEPDIASVTLIGEGQLCHRYQLVLDYLGIKGEITDASEIAVAGYESVYKHLYN